MASSAEGASAAAAKAGEFQMLSNIVNALLPAKLIRDAVDQLTAIQSVAAARQVLQLFVANTGCGQTLLSALSPLSKQALAALFTAATTDPSVVIGNCTAQDVPFLLLALAATHCPDNTYFKCNPSKNNFSMFETRPGAQLAGAVISDLLHKGNQSLGIDVGNSMGRIALAASQVSSAAACLSELPSFLASVPSNGLFNVTKIGLKLLCDTTNFTSPASGFNPSLLLQTGFIDPINAIAKGLKDVYKGKILQGQYSKQVAFYCRAWRRILSFGPKSNPVSLFTAAPTGFRCMLEGGPSTTCSSLPFGFKVEPTVDETHDLSYTTKANNKVTSIFPCPYK
eukprot:gene11610-11754_t